MKEKLDIFTVLKQNLPFLSMGAFGIYLFSKHFLYKKEKTDDSNIDMLIKRNTFKLQNSNILKKDNTQSLKNYLRTTKDPQIVELLKALDWGDPLNLPIMAIPFALDSKKHQIMLKKIMGETVEQEISNFFELLTHIEQKTNAEYLNNPIMDFPADDILTAFSLFGLQQNEKHDKIKKRFHQLSQKFHPDMIQGKIAEAQQKNIQHNYIILQKAHDILMKRKEI